jgi:superfamily I DNA/RNA helicase
LSSVVMLCTTTANWVSAVVPYLDKNKRCALLRYSNANSEIGAKELTEKGVEFTYVPQTPISDITTEAAWLYNAIAKHFILPTYSAYDLRDENPNEVVGNKHILQTIKISLKHLDEYLKQADKDSFAKEVEQLANSLGYSTKDEHCKKVYETICDKKFHPAFNIDGLQRIAITFHSSKGLEFDQVVLFTSDYRLATEQDICNHYVAATRAKSKLILVHISDDGRAAIYVKNIKKILAESNLTMRKIATVVDGINGSKQ